MNRLYEKYKKEIAISAVKDLNLGNIMEVPRIKKVSVNSGIGGFRENKDAVESFVTDLTLLTSQKPSPRKARLSEAGFKIKQGDVVGYTVTLRGERMWSFIDKLINVAIPRVRDFRGLSTESFDDDGNYSMGIREHVIFPEVNPNTTKGIRSLQVTIIFDSDEKDRNMYVLEKLGFPFREVSEDK